MKVFTIYDHKAETYGDLMFQPTLGAMLRALDQELEKEESYLTKYPEDYTLCEVGTWERQDGKFQTVGDKPTTIAHIVELKRHHLSNAERFGNQD